MNKPFMTYKEEADQLRAEVAALRAELQLAWNTCGDAEKERDALRAQLEAGQAQEPVGEVTLTYVLPDVDGKYMHEFVSDTRLPNQAELFIHAPDSAARIKELEAEVGILKETKESIWSALKAKEAEVLQLKQVISHESDCYEAQTAQVADLTEKLRVAREAINYCVKQVPELATVPGMSEALATIGGDT